MAPAVVAHRGCPRHGPENSLAGIRAAARLGATAVELDVRLTADGVPVLVHDPLLWRIARRPQPVRTISAATLRTVGLVDGDGEAPPTLDDALAAFSTGPAAGLAVALDLKVRGALGAAVAAVEAGAVDPARIHLWSHHDAVVAEAAAWGRAGGVALLRDTTGEPATLRLLDRAAALGATAVSLHPRVVDGAVVSAARGQGLDVYAWAQRVEEIEPLVAAGVAGVVTDFVEEAVAAVRSARST